MDLIDKPTFFGALGLLLAVTLPLIIFPEQGAAWVEAARIFVVETFGFAYLGFGVGAMIFMLFIAFSDIGRISFGHPDDEPEFSTASWAAMLFCAGIGASIIYWGTIEWAYYYQAPPFHVAPETPEAARWAISYGIFHWGPLAWSIYLVPALPIAYFYYVRKRRVLKVSEALVPVLGDKHSHGPLGKFIDVLFIFGMLGGAATSLGFAAPLINEGAHELFGAPKNLVTQIIVLLICTSIFGASAYAGLKKGIQKLSTLNMWMALILLAFIFIAGPTLFMANAGIDSLGIVFGNIIEMATWTEPFGDFENFEDSQFPQNWTIFYWAWWLAYAPGVGLFIARISRGRTMKGMILGSLFFGTLGCFLFFMILGNYGIYLQLTGQIDVLDLLNNQSATAAIFGILGELPLRYLVIGLYTLLAVVFTATTLDSISYISASVVQRKLDDEPMRWNRLFWAFALSFMPISLLLLGGRGLETLQTASIVAGAPLLIVATLLCVSLVKVARYDMQNQPGIYRDDIHITEFPETDPWSDSKGKE